MSFYNLEDLKVYQLAEGFGDEIWFIVHEWDYFAKRYSGETSSKGRRFDKRQHRRRIRTVSLQGKQKLLLF